MKSIDYHQDADAVSPARPDQVAQSETVPAPPFVLSVGLAIGLVVLMAILRLYSLPGRVLPIAYGVPLVACVWFRSRRILWSMVVAFSVISLIKYGWVWRPDPEYPGATRWMAWAMVQADMVAVALFVHYVIGAREAAEARSATLLQYSREMFEHEERITAQNRELQAQGEELSAQSEELARQTEELRVINDELTQREIQLEQLLGLSHSLTADLSRQQVTERIVRAVEAMIGMEGGASAAVLERKGSELEIIASYGVDSVDGHIAADHALTTIVLERGEVGHVSDLSLRPDLWVPRQTGGTLPQSILAAPLRLNGGGRMGSLEIYTRKPFNWGPSHVVVVRALAAQASVSLANAALVEELERRRRDAEEAAVRKTRFLAAVSHDIRTPANAINLLAELLVTITRDPTVPMESPEEVPQLARELRDGALSLVQLVSDVLDVTRYDYGKVELQISEFVIEKLYDDQIRQHRNPAAAKGVSLSAAGLIGAHLRADYVKLGRILSNLLGNAVKFTDIGAVQLATSIAPDGKLVLAVTDTGPGIAPEHQPLIFDEFYQVKNPARDRSHGTGLGLAICKRLVEAMGGALTVTSDIGRGSTFTVTLPSDVVVSAGTLGFSDGVAYTPPGLPIPPNALSGVSVLLVEDHDVTRAAVSQILRGAGARVIESPTVKDALAHLDDGLADAMLLDMMLPDAHGTTVLRHLQEQGRPPALKVVMVLTGDVTPERGDEAHRLGADAVLHKPVDPNAVITFLREKCVAKSTP